VSTNLFTYPQSFPLEAGGSLPGFELAYTLTGTPAADGSNLIWVCHALTANAEVDSWWPGLFGPGHLFDPGRYAYLCANMLGSCYGSTNALSVNPETGAPFYHDFPLLTNRDIVRAFDLLREQLGFERMLAVIGGSMGGQQAIEWAIMRPEVFAHLIPVATNARHSAWGIAFNEAQRMAIAVDASWTGRHPEAGLTGMRAARALALLSYRGYAGYNETQTEPTDDKLDDFLASSYQQYQGDKLKQRFHAFAYWTLSKAMDSQHVGRGRGGLENALAQVQARTLAIGIDSDLLFPVAEQQLIAAHVPHGTYREVSSTYAHDGFLIETAQLAGHIEAFLR
jgi:homoserine O-acetyltransferase/O-succinyltransferase